MGDIKMGKNDALAYTFLALSVVVVLIVGVFAIKMIVNQSDSSDDYVEVPVSYMEQPSDDTHTSVVIDDAPEPEPVAPTVPDTTQTVTEPIVPQTPVEPEEVTCKTKVKALENDLEDLFEDIDAARDDLYDYYEDLEDAQADLADAQNRSDDRDEDRAKDDIDDAEKDIEDAEDAIKDLEDDIEEKIEDLDDEEIACDKEIRSEVYKELKAKFDTASDCKRVVDEVEEYTDDADDDLTDAEDELDDAQEDLSEAKDDISALTSNSTKEEELRAEADKWDAEQMIDRWENREDSLNDLVDFYKDTEDDFDRECD